jgi:coiled-coil domain-containing protein 55
MGAVNQTVNKEAARSKVRKQTQLEIDKALQEDPNIYEYDDIYDDIKDVKVKTDVKEKNKQDRKVSSYSL